MEQSKWSWDGQYPIKIRDEEGYTVCEMFPSCEKFVGLIASAPELLEAADNALGVLIACCVSAGGVDDRKAILDAQAQLRAAISRATSGDTGK